MSREGRMPPESMPRIEDLLAQRGWLLSLATSLVGRDAAEDVVQETLVTAVEKPPRSTDAMRSWLARVLRSKASNHHRSRQRVRSRERAAARREAYDASTALSQAELQSKIARALSQLAEPDRDLILRRYYADHSAAEIAEDLGLPSSTVRTRLARALERLRQTLDTDAPDWRPMVVLWLDAPTRSAAVGTAGAGGLVTMKKIAAAFLLVLVTLGIVGPGADLLERWPSTATGTPPPGEPGTAARDSMAATTSSGTHVAVARVGPTTSSASKISGSTNATNEESDPAAIVRGRIRLSSGASLLGAAVRISSGGTVAEARLNPAGEFELHYPHEEDVELELDRGTHLIEIAQVRTSFDFVSEVDLVVEDDASLSFQIVDLQSGDPVEGAIITVQQISEGLGTRRGLAKSDADGAASIECLQPTRYRIDIRAPGRREWRAESRPSDEAIVVELESAATVRIEFENWEDYTLTYVTPFWRMKGQGSASGRGFPVEEWSGVLDVELPSSGDWLLELHELRIPPILVSLEPGVVPDPIRVVLPRKSKDVRLRGVVREASGATLPGIELLSAVGRSTITNARGEFELEIPDRPETHLSVRYPTQSGLISMRLRCRVQPDAENEAYLDLELPGKDCVRVRVAGLTEDTYGDTVDLTVSLLGRDASAAISTVFGYSDEGIFELRYLPEGRYQASLEVGDRPLPDFSFEVPGPDVEIEFTEPVRLQVELPEDYQAFGYRAAADSAGLGPQVRFWFFPATSPIPETQDRGEWGRLAVFETSARSDRDIELYVPPGEYRLLLVAPGYEPWIRPVKLREGRDDRLEISALIERPRPR